MNDGYRALRARGHYLLCAFYIVLFAVPSAGAESDWQLLRGDIRALLVPEKVAWGALSLGAAVLAHPLDDEFAGSIDHDLVEPVLDFGNWYAGTKHSLGGAIALRSLAHFSGSPELVGVSSQLLRALLLANGLVAPFKVGVRRERPDGSNRFSFPSGHSANSFAMAAVLARRYGKVVGVPIYVLSTFVPVARIHDRHHYFSDVVAGAALGSIAGWVVMREPTVRQLAVVPFMHGHWGLRVHWSY
ncbi:MAG: membrane-associated phospholipid phosphatase [Candidatus Latescibacterota bacterium]|jgi:membrane-associated phospholipid phosphatase